MNDPSEQIVLLREPSTALMQTPNAPITTAMEGKFDMRPWETAREVPTQHDAAVSPWTTATHVSGSSQWIDTVRKALLERLADVPESVRDAFVKSAGMFDVPLADDGIDDLYE